MGWRLDKDRSHTTKLRSGARFVTESGTHLPRFHRPSAGLYFWLFFSLGIKEALLVGRFASPTSTGILFTMLVAAGLAGTWLYKKGTFCFSKRDRTGGFISRQF
jgi:hypothetical protein